MKIAANVTELIGNTPLVRLNGISDRLGVEIIGKCEFMNPSSSVKDRIGYAMIQGAMQRGEISKDTVIIEPTSGNTGIALAGICTALGIRLILTMPSSMSIERQKILRALGAELELTPPPLGMKGAVDRAVELSHEIPNALILQQFDNPDNPAVHRRTTAQEILRDTEGNVDAFVAAVGTGGTLTGTGSVLKESIAGIKIVAVEPSASPVLSGGAPAPHRIQGIGAGFVPGVLDKNVYDEILTVSNEDAFETARMIAREEGILIGISAGANVYASMQLATRPEYQGKRIVTILCDTGERYLSTDLFGSEG